ncbi:DUF6776 family protein [Marinobacter sp. X15-166B]|uniref:DUF6776 family protein n=1 Tax=Marinobacter sp. X15-166B TaxID=1897620 RepID=UPI00085C2306|nr:DUF6776 family protein [Marinobacter sp. X15-166B]OEY66526.1 hypothetical protein BG841_08695 [Marinobacter sp. X15-166B]
MSRKKPEYVVVRHQPGRVWWGLLVLILCTCAAAAVGYQVGQTQGDEHFTRVLQSRDALLASEATLKTRLMEAEQRVIQLERGRSMDTQALNQARRSLTELETTIAGLKSDLTFYKTIMAPSAVSKGLQVDQLTIQPARGEQDYAFKLVLTQVGGNKNFISGVVAVSVMGLRHGEQEIIALRDLSPDIKDLGVKFRFRYFQDIEGRLSFPEGFEPIEVQVVAKSQGRRPTQSERTFDWHELTES